MTSVVRYPSAAPGTWGLDFLLPTTSFGSQASFWSFQTSLQQSGRVCWRCLLLPGKHLACWNVHGCPSCRWCHHGWEPEPQKPHCAGCCLPGGCLRQCLPSRGSSPQRAVLPSAWLPCCCSQTEQKVWKCLSVLPLVTMCINRRMR